MIQVIHKKLKIFFLRVQINFMEGILKRNLKLLNNKHHYMN